MTIIKCHSIKLEHNNKINKNDNNDNNVDNNHNMHLKHNDNKYIHAQEYLCMISQYKKTNNNNKINSADNPTKT